ncbi:hypothetical protein SNEBB_007679 [Seison nebaliae]|nr:hypothetical protein SNEBB_007679 [Seison nebaliae]
MVDISDKERRLRHLLCEQYQKKNKNLAHLYDENVFSQLKNFEKEYYKEQEAERKCKNFGFKKLEVNEETDMLHTPKIQQNDQKIRVKRGNMSNEEYCATVLNESRKDVARSRLKKFEHNQRELAKIKIVKPDDCLDRPSLITYEPRKKEELKEGDICKTEPRIQSIDEEYDLNNARCCTEFLEAPRIEKYCWGECKGMSEETEKFLKTPRVISSKENVCGKKLQHTDFLRKKLSEQDKNNVIEQNSNNNNIIHEVKKESSQIINDELIKDDSGKNLNDKDEGQEENEIQPKYPPGKKIDPLITECKKYNKHIKIQKRNNFKKKPFNRNEQLIPKSAPDKFSVKEMKVVEIINNRWIKEGANHFGSKKINSTKVREQIEKERNEALLFYMRQQRTIVSILLWHSSQANATLISLDRAHSEAQKYSDCIGEMRLSTAKFIQQHRHVHPEIVELLEKEAKEQNTIKKTIKKILKEIYLQQEAMGQLRKVADGLIDQRKEFIELLPQFGSPDHVVSAYWEVKRELNETAQIHQKILKGMLGSCPFQILTPEIRRICEKGGIAIDNAKKTVPSVRKYMEDSEEALSILTNNVNDVIIKTMKELQQINDHMVIADCKNKISGLRTKTRYENFDSAAKVAPMFYEQHLQRYLSVSQRADRPLVKHLSNFSRCAIKSVEKEQMERMKIYNEKLCHMSFDIGKLKGLKKEIEKFVHYSRKAGDDLTELWRMRRMDMKAGCDYIRGIYKPKKLV